MKSKHQLKCLRCIYQKKHVSSGKQIDLMFGKKNEKMNAHLPIYYYYFRHNFAHILIGDAHWIQKTVVGK